jgi:phospholipid N-methyltransferase
MVRGIDFSKLDVIVELGPGTGVFTKEIIARSMPTAKIILIEIEPSYVALLKRKFGDRVIIEEASAEKLDTILAKYSVAHPDLIVSGLPFLKDEAGKMLIRSIARHTAKGTIFRFFTYMPPVMKRVYRELPVRRHSFVLSNIPPLFAYGIN